MEEFTMNLFKIAFISIAKAIVTTTVFVLLIVLSLYDNSKNETIIEKRAYYLDKKIK